MIETVLGFKKLQEELPGKISESKYKASHFIKELGLSNATFYRKASEKKFTPDEMLKIIELVDPKEYYRWELAEELKQAEEEIANGKGISNEEAKKIINAN